MPKLKVRFRNTSDTMSKWWIFDMNNPDDQPQTVELDEDQTSEPLEFFPNPGSHDVGVVNIQRTGGMQEAGIEIEDGATVDVE
jgi:hypothetical protein